MEHKSANTERMTGPKRKRDTILEDAPNPKRRELSSDHEALKVEEKQSTFLGLPPELRNSIYALVFTFGDCKPYNPVPAYRGLHSCQCRGQTLMRVCRQTRKETLALFYQNHEFRLLLSDDHKLAVQTWLDSLAPDAFNHIKRFQFRQKERRYEGQYWRWTNVYATFVIGEADVEVAVVVTSEATVSRSTHEKVEMEASEELEASFKKVAASMDKVEGRPVLTRAKMLELLEVVGWKPSK
ncbi:hypothetical protein M409DRAFT_57454 [Zasmidium cellare ATCC 36951]|uniref:Uncharacterized protein n=1 Tax=Zasmidium cellare ATCC 36951 TaxID=1080233 RepID=A0A6A6CCZ9_ZASCE|nr:uncharacterized protein M409DRAFT_57454 [Zasmidium cellare ATCC 36951]KAF2163569.1 hypothetical protein M409DRAFT_57454 [Zasmidium cellare ATCC 36951]